MVERKLNIPFYSLRASDIDMTVIRDIGGEEEFELCIENLAAIKTPMNDDRLKIRVKDNGDYFRARIESSSGTLFEIENSYADSGRNLMFVSGQCACCEFYDACKVVQPRHKKSIYMCADITSMFLVMFIHAIRDYYIYKYHLKPKRYACNQKMYPASELYSNKEADYYVVKFVDFPLFKEYLERYSEVELDMAYEMALCRFINDVLGEVIEDDKDIEIDRAKDISRYLVYEVYTTKGLEKEQVDRLAVLHQHLDNAVTPDTFLRFLSDMLIETGIKDGELDGRLIYTDEEDNEITEAEARFLAESRAFQELVSNDKEKEEELKEETAVAQTESTHISEPEESVIVKRTLPDGFRIEVGEEDKYRRLYFMIPGEQKEYTRQFNRLSYDEVCDVAENLNTLLKGGVSEDKRALRIYNSLSISKQHAESLVDELLTHYDRELKAKNEELEELRRENYELRLQLEWLSGFKSNTQVEPSGNVDEMWQGELQHFINMAVKQVIKQWAPNNNGKRRGFDVLSEYIKGIEDSAYPDMIHQTIHNVFRGNTPFESKRAQLNSVGFELELTSNSHYRIYPIGHKEYAYILSGTPSDFRSYKNGINDYTRILFQ